MTIQDEKILDELARQAQLLTTVLPIEANIIRRDRNRWLVPYVNGLVDNEAHWTEVRTTLHQRLQGELYLLEMRHEEAWNRFEQAAFLVAIRDWAHARYAAFNQTRAGAGHPAITSAVQNESTRRTLAQVAIRDDLPDLKLYVAAYEAALHFTSRTVYQDAYRRLISVSAKCGDCPQLAPYNLLISLRRIHRNMLSRLGDARCILSAMSRLGIDGRHHASLSMSSQRSGGNQSSTASQIAASIPSIRSLRRELLQGKLDQLVWPEDTRARKLVVLLFEQLGIASNARWLDLLPEPFRAAVTSPHPDNIIETDIDWLAVLYLTNLIRGYSTAPRFSPPLRSSQSRTSNSENVAASALRTPESRWVTLLHIIGELYPKFELSGICQLRAQNLRAPLSTYNGHGYTNCDISVAQNTPIRAVRPVWLRLDYDVLSLSASVEPGFYRIVGTQSRALNISGEAEFETKTEGGVFGRRHNFDTIWTREIRNLLEAPNGTAIRLTPTLAGAIARMGTPVYQFLVVLLWPQRLTVTGANTSVTGASGQPGRPAQTPSTPAINPEYLNAATRNRLRRQIRPDATSFFRGLFDLAPSDSRIALDRLHRIQEEAWSALESILTTSNPAMNRLWRILASRPFEDANRINPSGDWLTRAILQRGLTIFSAASVWTGSLPSSESEAVIILRRAREQFENRFLEVVQADPITSGSLQQAAFVFYNWLAGRVGMTGSVASGIQIPRDRPFPDIDSNGEHRATTPGHLHLAGSQVTLVHEYIRTANLQRNLVFDQQQVFVMVAYRHLSSVSRRFEAARQVSDASNLLESEAAPMIGTVGMTGNSVSSHVHMQIELHTQNPLRQRYPTPPIATLSPAEFFLPISALTMPGHNPHAVYHDIALIYDPLGH